MGINQTFCTLCRLLVLVFMIVGCSDGAPKGNKPPRDWPLKDFTLPPTAKDFTFTADHRGTMGQSASDSEDVPPDTWWATFTHKGDIAKVYHHFDLSLANRGWTKRGRAEEFSNSYRSPDNRFDVVITYSETKQVNRSKAGGSQTYTVRVLVEKRVTEH